MERPTRAEVAAAAHVLHAAAREHGWYPTALPDRYDQMDPIGRDEFEALVERMLMAAADARA